MSPNNSRVEDKHGEEERHKGVAGKAAGHRKELNEEEEYNPLKMPPDWKLASNHAKARSTAPDKKKDGANEKGIFLILLIKLRHVHVVVLKLKDNRLNIVQIRWL